MVSGIEYGMLLGTEHYWRPDVTRDGIWNVIGDEMLLGYHRTRDVTGDGIWKVFRDEVLLGMQCLPPLSQQSNLCSVECFRR